MDTLIPHMYAPPKLNTPHNTRNICTEPDKENVIHTLVRRCMSMIQASSMTCISGLCIHAPSAHSMHQSLCVYIQCRLYTLLLTLNLNNNDIVIFFFKRLQAEPSRSQGKSCSCAFPT